MKSPAVQTFCLDLWEARERGDLAHDQAGTLSRRLVEAAAADIGSVPAYEPGSDARFTWALAVLDALRFRRPGARASGDLEATVAFMLERREAVKQPGKDMAWID